MPFINIPSYGSASWKDAVADPASLPASGNEVGDARVTESTSEIYVWDGSAWQNVGGSASAITALTNDVTATGPGSVAATVAFVGGETAADVATSVQDTQAATDLSTVSTIVKRDASGETSLDGLNLDGSVSGAINIKAADTTAGYTIKMPNAQGGATTYLENDGSGNLSWGTVSAGMTNPMTTQGDLITGGAAGAPQRLGLGTEEYVLAAGATDPYWTIEGVKTGYPTDTVIVGRTKPVGLTGVSNTIIGAGAGNAIGSGIVNTFVGRGAGSSTTQTRNTAVGYNAMTSNVDSSTCVGFQANTTGSNAVAIGSHQTSAAGNGIAIGRDARAGSSCVTLGVNSSSQGLSSVFTLGSVTAQINTLYLGRGGASQTVANAVKIQTMRSSGTDTDMSVGTLTLAGAQGTGTGAGGDVIIATAPPDVASGSSLNAHVERMRVTDDGDVGINVVAPTKRFHVFSGSNQCVATFQSDTTGGGITLQDATTTSDTHVGVGANGDDLCFRSGGVVGSNMTLDASGNLKVPDYIISPAHYDEGTETGNFTIDWANSPVQTVTLNGTTNATVTLSNPVQGGAYVLRIIQGATPGTIDFTAGGFADAVWPGGTAPTLSGSTGDVDVINLLYIDDGGGTVTYYGTFATDFS